MKHPAVHVTFSVDAIVSAKLTHPVVVQISEFGRHIEIGTSGKFPNEMVPGFFDILRHTNIFGPLFLRVEFGLFTRFA